MNKDRMLSTFSSVLTIQIMALLFPVSYSHHDGMRFPVFRDTTTEKFTHIIVHNTTGDVYIGGVNRIYQLNEDLNLEATALMGPQHDSPECHVTRVCPGETKVPTDYYNKALLIDPYRSKLLSCGSLFQGACTLHDLDYVSTYQTAANISVVANKGTGSTVAFIAPTPDSSDEPYALYVGVSYTGHGPYSSHVPSVSSRSLNPRHLLTLFHGESVVGSRIMVNTLSRETYPITYVYGFSSEGFAYFVTVQKQSESSPGPFVSKLVRICQNDVDFYSYTEVPLSCRAPDGTDYNLAQAAYVEKPGYELASHLGIQNRDQLFVAFAKSGDTLDHPSQNSALCMFSMPDIRRRFTENIQRCFAGHGYRGLDFITPNVPCLRTVLKIEDDFCGLDINTPLDGTIPIEAAPVLRFPEELLTAVTVTSTQGYTVVFLGTSTGHLKKAVIETADTAVEYYDTEIEEGSPVNPNMAFDRTKDHIYVMTQNTVSKVIVRECHSFQTCTDCLGAGDPYCGWCVFENRCLTKKACEEATQNSSSWFPYNRNCCNVITEAHQKSPDSTAASGNTMDTTGEQGMKPMGRPQNRVTERSKLSALEDIAQSMRNIDQSLKELIDLQKQKN